MLLFDAHLDISMNATEWSRDLTRPLEEMRKGEIGICIATQIGRYVAPDNDLPGWHSPEIACPLNDAAGGPNPTPNYVGRRICSCPL